MKDYSELTSKIYVQLSPELSQEFHNMLTDMAKEISRLYEIENAKPSEALESLEKLGDEKLARGELIRNDNKVEPYLNTIKQALIELEQLRERDRFNAIGKSIQYCKNEVIK